MSCDTVYASSNWALTLCLLQAQSESKCPSLGPFDTLSSFKKISFFPPSTNSFYFFNSTLVFIYQTIVFWNPLLFGTSNLIVSGGRVHICVWSSYSFLPCCPLFGACFHVIGNLSTLPVPTSGVSWRVRHTWKLKLCWNTNWGNSAFGTLDALLNRSVQRKACYWEFHRFLIFWSFYLATHHLLSCAELTANYWKKPQNGGHKVHHVFQKPNLSCLRTLDCSADISFPFETCLLFSTTI